MTINSRFWGIGWREEDLPSIPGRTPRLKAIYLLQIAAEVEHALMAQYLYAAYSLDEALGQGDESPGTSIVDRWKRDIRLIARQEMAHFVTVQNLLLSLGAEVYVARENNFSDHPDAYPFPVTFERFGVPSLARYVATERPASEEIKDKKTWTLLKQILKLADSELQTKVKRVGILYAALYWLFLRGDASVGPWRMPNSLRKCMKESELEGVHVRDTDFVPPREYEEFAASRAEWEVSDESLHVDNADPRSRALKAIQWIMLQGEGPSGSDCATETSHFCRFLSIYEDVKEHPDLLTAARHVPVNPVVQDTHRKEPVQPDAQVITHPESKLWAQLFSVRYQMLLLDILIALSTSRRKAAGLRSTLTTWASAHEMEHLKRIGQLLPTLPRHPGETKLRAGAPFETAQFPPDNTKRWDFQRVLIKGSNDLVRRLKKMVSPHDERFGILTAISTFDTGRRAEVEQHSSVKRQYDWKSGGNQRI